MIKKYLIPLAILVGVIWDILFWETDPGFSYPLFITLALAAGLLLLCSEKRYPSLKSILLMGLILFFSVFTFVRGDLFTTLMNYGMSVFLLLLFTGTYESGEWSNYNLFDYVAKFIHLLSNLIRLPLGFLFKNSDNHAEDKPRKQDHIFWQIMRGLILAIPILVVFVFLLSSADLVFAQRTEGLFQLFNMQNLQTWFIQGLLVLIIAYVYIGIIRYAQLKSNENSLSGNSKHMINSFLGFTESVTVLASVMILFSIFVGIQFKYLFSGGLNISTTGFTFSEYARRGFGELVWVAVFSLILVKAIRTALKQDNHQQGKIISGLTIGLISLVLIILISSFQRLSLYESAYGFSKLRTYSHVFIIWLGLLLIGVIVLELIKRQSNFTNAILLAMVGFTLSLNFLNVDAFIVARNVERADDGVALDMNYLNTLSADAVPQLVKEFNSSVYSSGLHETIGGVLACQNLKIESYGQESSKNDWRSFNLGEWNANRQLITIKTALDQYLVSENDFYETEIISPSGVKYNCRPYARFD